MSRSKVWVTILAGAAAVGALAYVYTRRARSGAGRGPANEAPVPASGLRDSEVVPSRAAESELEALDLDGVFEGELDGSATELTVQSATRAPPLSGADDGEPPNPDELGAYWLSRAAESEHSPTEGELVLDFDELVIADPGDSDEIDEGDRLSAEAWRG